MKLHKLATGRNVFSQVEPKRLSLEAANQQLATAEERLRAVQNKIAALEEALVKLKAEYTRATDAKLRCQVGLQCRFYVIFIQ